MSTETEPKASTRASRLPPLPIAVVSLLVLGFTNLSWGFAPQGGPAALPGAIYTDKTNAQLAEASHHAATLAASITEAAAIIVVIAMVTLMIRPIRYGYLLISAITPVALVAVWLTTRADLAVIAARY